jgi:hypothetical protein
VLSCSKNNGSLKRDAESISNTAASSNGGVFEAMGGQPLVPTGTTRALDISTRPSAPPEVSSGTAFDQLLLATSAASGGQAIDGSHAIAQPVQSGSASNDSELHTGAPCTQNGHQMNQQPPYSAPFGRNVHNFSNGPPVGVSLLPNGVPADLPFGYIQTNFVDGQFQCQPGNFPGTGYMPQELLAVQRGHHERLSNLDPSLFPENQSLDDQPPRYYR